MNKILSFKDYSELYINPRRTKSETCINNTNNFENTNNTKNNYDSDSDYDEYDFFVKLEQPFQNYTDTNNNKSKKSNKT